MASKTPEHLISEQEEQAAEERREAAYHDAEAHHRGHSATSGELLHLEAIAGAAI